jgi:hypothetical protein
MTSTRKRHKLKPVLLRKRDVAALNNTAEYCIKLLEAQYLNSDVEYSVLQLANNFLALYNTAIHGQFLYVAESNSIH